jgi:NitT/TauT family transport system ATP-binding protein
MSVALNSISKSFDGVRVFDGFSHMFPSNSITAVTGPSGSGKTTLLRIIAGFEKADGGEVRIDGKKISMVFQEDRLLPSKTALENVAAVTDRENARRWLEKVGLKDDACTLPGELSGGMKRRVAIARALAFGGDILLLDEPFMGLDPDLHDSIFDLILREKGKACIILVTHDMEDAAKCDFRVSI